MLTRALLCGLRRAHMEPPAAGEPPMPSRQLTVLLAECTASLSGLAALLAQPLAGAQAKPGLPVGERRGAGAAGRRS